MAEAKLQVVLDAKDNASSKVKGLEMSFAKMTGAVALGTAAYDAFKKVASLAIGVVKDSIGAYAEAEASQVKVNAILRTLKGSFESHIKVVDEAARKALLLGFDDEAAAESMAKLLQTTGDTTTAQQAMTAAMDLARFKGIDLESATQGINLAMQGSARILKQLGIDIPEDATKMEMLGLIHDKVKGQAEAFGTTAAGAQEKLKNAIENAQEALGEKFAPVFSRVVNTITNFVTSEKFTAFLNDVQRFVNEKVIPPIRDVLIPLFMEHLKPAIAEVQKVWEKHKDVLIPIIKIIGGVAAGGLVFAILAAVAAVQLLAGMVDGLVTGFKQLVEWAIKAKNAVPNIGRGITGFGEAVGGLFPGRAAGGLVSGGRPYMVGEQGSEMFIPNTGGRILPNNQVGGGSITVNFNNPIVRSNADLDSIINEVRRALSNDLRLNRIGA